MTSATRPCHTCRAETTAQQIAHITGQEKDLALTLRGLPILTCASDHKQFVRASFALDLLNHLVEQDEPQLPAGEAKGLLFKHYHCKSCGQELQAKPDHRHTFTLDIALPDTSAFQIDLTSPVYKCSGCGHEQLHSLQEVRKLTPEALVHAFKSAGISSG